MMSPSRLLGPGRDRRFQLPQYFAELNGTETAYFDTGGPGETLFFIHGLAGNLTHWLHVAPPFAQRYRLVGIDLPGCGETGEHPDGFSVYNYARQVLALLDMLDIPQATLVGHSLGGMVSMEVARQAPERAKALFLIGSAGFQPVPLVLRQAGKLVLNERLLGALLPRVWQGLLGHVMERDNAHTRAFVESVATTYDPAKDVVAIARVMAGLKRDFLYQSYEGILERLHMPVMLMWGESDRLVPARGIKRLKRSKVDVELVPDCGHMPMIEAPEAVVAGLERFLVSTR